MDTVSTAPLPGHFPVAAPGAAPAAPAGSEAPPPAIERAELARRLARPDPPLVLDVRRGPRFDQATTLLAGARRCAPEDIEAWLQGRSPGEVVVYCVYGHEVSQGAARTLRRAGWDARYLAGGIEGGEPGTDNPEAIAAWRAQPLWLVQKEPGHSAPGQENQKESTR